MESGRGQHPSSTLGINLDISHNFCPLVESGLFFWVTKETKNVRKEIYKGHRRAYKHPHYIWH